LLNFHTYVHEMVLPGLVREGRYNEQNGENSQNPISFGKFRNSVSHIHSNRCMENLIQQLTDNPILLVIALVLVAVAIYTLVERLLKPALFLLVLLAVYIGYLVMTEQEIPEEIQKGKAFVEEIADKAKKEMDK